MEDKINAPSKKTLDRVLANTATHLAKIHGKCKLDSGEGECRIDLRKDDGQRIRIIYSAYRSNNTPNPELYETVVSVKNGVFGEYRTVMRFFGPRQYEIGPWITEHGDWENTLLNADEKIYYEKSKKSSDPERTGADLLTLRYDGNLRIVGFGISGPNSRMYGYNYDTDFPCIYLGMNEPLGEPVEKSQD